VLLQQDLVGRRGDLGGKRGIPGGLVRVVLLGIGLLSGQIEWFLLAIAVVSFFTLFQRLFTIRRMLSKGG